MLILPVTEAAAAPTYTTELTLGRPLTRVLVSRDICVKPAGVVVDQAGTVGAAAALVTPNKSSTLVDNGVPASLNTGDVEVPELEAEFVSVAVLSPAIPITWIVEVAT